MISVMRVDHLATRPDRAGRYTLRFEDGTSLRLYRQTVEDFGLYAGMELDEGELIRLRQSAGEMSAKMRAVRIVSASSVSKSDLQHRLIQKGEDPKQAAHAVEWMAELNLLDDRQTAAQVVSRCVSKGYGLQRAKQALYEKRIPREYWEEALEDYPDQTEKIVAFLRSRLSSDGSERAVKRAVDALLRRGHSYSDVRQALRQLEQEDFLEEE